MKGSFAHLPGPSRPGCFGRPVLAGGATAIFGCMFPGFTVESAGMSAPHLNDRHKPMGLHSDAASTGAAVEGHHSSPFLIGT
ncbi:Uncharacterized protein HZ326_9313 [Fusarium oxysporum f. sp. albedinis]|nr:Uncharacterized protein HZ326_9313 [Fusarium oxysporum f. sp. albedinis]